MSEIVTEKNLKNLFGNDAYSEAPLSKSGAGIKFYGIDLCNKLGANKVEFLLNALSRYRIICIANQNLDKFSLNHLETFANYWGAPVPHPSNFKRGGKSAQSDGETSGIIEWTPIEQRQSSLINKVFPDQLECLPHKSPAVLVVSNFQDSVSGSGIASNDDNKKITVGNWHTDIEYEPVPIYVSMFLAHHLPTNRSQNTGNWITPPVIKGFNETPYFPGSDPDLLRLRLDLPLNGETAFADTVAAFASLPENQRNELANIKVLRKLNENDTGWFAPLVRTNPLSGLKSLHSPIWASRPGERPPITVENMTEQESRTLLDELELHVLQPQFRYHHPHVPGDVTVWDNYMTIHNNPFIKTNINNLGDARLLYRISCKGSPSLNLPRKDPEEWLKKNITASYRTPLELLQLANH